MAAAVAYGAAAAAAAPQLYSPPPAAPTACWGGALDPEEISQRLQKTHWELGNRRKIHIRNLPPDTSSQEIHELLQDYQLKYCYVDRSKGTAFVTLLNGEQARDAIQRFHGYLLADQEISVQLQPTDALLCITNLPPTFTLQEFEELLRAYGNIERCFLVYSEVTGHSKGYGFVEYMKKDYAAKARQELIGKQLREFTLFAQWMDINQLTADLIHSKCLCVDKLPKDYQDSEELTQIFSSFHTPVFCQLSKDEGSSFGGFAVIEYDTAEQAEEVKLATNGMIISKSSVQISFCAPGSPGRSTLAALIAAHGMAPNSQNGLLPEPNPMQILKSLNNPAMVQMLLQPKLRALIRKHALGASSLVPQFLNTQVNPTFLHPNNAHQKSSLGNPSALLQNFSHLQMAQQQLLKLKSTQSVNNKPGLLGEAPASLLPTALGMGPGQSMADLTHLGEPQKAAFLTPSQIPAARMGILPFFSNHQGGAHQISGLPQEKQSGAVIVPERGIPGSKTFQNFANNSTQSLLMDHNKPSNQSKGINPNPGGSLLGEPPKEYRMSTNPYLNLSSVFSNTSLPNVSSRNNNVGHHSRMMGSATNTSFTQGSTPQSTLENYYSQQYGDYTQEGAQQWYTQCQSTYEPSQEQSYQQENTEKEPYPPGTGEGYYNTIPPTSEFGDYSTYVQLMSSFYTGSPGAYQPPTSLQTNLQAAVQTPVLQTAARNEKRGASFLLPSPDVYPVSYAEQRSQDGGEYYADLQQKKRRIY